MASGQPTVRSMIVAYSPIDGQYEVKTVKNTTKWRPGQDLSKNEVDSAIRSGVSVTIR